MFDPATVSGALILGVVAGLVVSALLFLLGTLLQKALVPWLQDLLYKGVDLRGLWIEEKNLSGIRYNYQLNLQQSSEKLKGTMTITKSGAPAGPRGDYVQRFEVTGQIWEGFVTLNLKSLERNSLAIATVLLRIAERAHSLIGNLAYRSSTTDEVASEAVHWR